MGKLIGTIIFLGIVIYGGMTVYKRGGAPNINDMFDDVSRTLSHIRLR